MSHCWTQGFGSWNGNCPHAVICLISSPGLVGSFLAHRLGLPTGPNGMVLVLTLLFNPLSSGNRLDPAGTPFLTPATLQGSAPPWGGLAEILASAQKTGLLKANARKNMELSCTDAKSCTLLPPDDGVHTNSWASSCSSADIV